MNLKTKMVLVGVYTGILLGSNAGYKLLYKTHDMSITKSDIVNVYDGDSFTINIPKIPAVFGEKIGIRLGGVDTPELRSAKCVKEKLLAKDAKVMTKNLLLNADDIELKDVRRGKYFRLVADVYVDGVSLSKTLIDNNLGYAYNGGTKQSWCE